MQLQTVSIFVDDQQRALCTDKWRANKVARDNPDVLLEELPGG